MVIGLTVVAFGTSAPELAASLTAALSGTPEIAIGNVVGSNIANVGLILGLTAMVYPLVTGSRFVRREVPLMLLVTALLVPVLWGGAVLRWEGGILLALLAGFLWVITRTGSSVLEEVRDAPARRMPVWLGLLGTAAGIALLSFGARALVTGAVQIATSFGIPQRVIGLTLVAVGTSLPELASSMVAAMRRETDIILGNIVGSNVFNLLAVLGTTALVKPIRFDGAGATIDIAVMALFSVALLPLMWRGERLGRAAGFFLLVGYAAYILTLVA
jgi:cation:H+ antiporter